MYRPYGAATESTANRPGCVTFLAILYWFGAIGGMVAVLVLGNSGLIVAAGNMGLALVGLALAFGVFQAVVGWGLWRMRNWARVLVILMQLVALIGPILALFSGAGLEALVSMIVPGFIVIWLVAHDVDFRQ